MTGSSMITQFLIFYDRISNMSAPGYETDEILVFLNSAQDEFIKARMFGKDFQPPAFEQNQKRVADLQTLLQSTQLTLLPGGVASLYGEKIYLLPSATPKFLYYVDSISSLIRTNYPVISSAKNIKNKYVAHADVQKFANSELNYNHFLHPIVWIESGLLKVLGDRFTTIANLTMNYIREPNAIADNSNALSLPAHTHQEVVEIAVRQALQTIQDPRWQTSIIEAQQKTQ